MVTLDMIRERVKDLYTSPEMKLKLKTRLRSYLDEDGLPVGRIGKLQEKDYLSFYSLINIMN